MNRGDVILVRFPHPSGLRGKKRPAVVVQSDAYAGTVSTLVVAEVTMNLTMASDPACLFIDTSTPEGRATGLVRGFTTRGGVAPACSSACTCCSVSSIMAGHPLLVAPYASSPLMTLPCTSVRR